MVSKFKSLLISPAVVEVVSNDLRSDLRYNKSSIPPHAQVCDASKASFIFYCPAQKNLPAICMILFG